MAPHTGNWRAQGTSAQVQGQSGGAGAGDACVAFVSLSRNASSADHFVDSFNGAIPTAPLTVSFLFNPDSLNPLAVQTLKLHLQLRDDQVKWSFEVMGPGLGYRFNNAALGTCAHCPAPGSGWHKLTVVSSGTVTSSLAFDGFPPETAITTSYNSGTTPDTLGLDVLHITAGDCLNSPGAKFLLDELQVTSP
jgi:hypothetical protein